MLIETVESYRKESEYDVKSFIEEQKADAEAKGYTIKSYSSTFKQKKQKGEVIDEGYLVKIVKVHANFWEI